LRMMGVVSFEPFLVPMGCEISTDGVRSSGLSCVSFFLQKKRYLKC